MMAAVLKESRRLVTVQENGEMSQITARDAVIRAQIKSAATGSPYAQEYQLRRFERAEKEEMAAIEAANAVAELYIESCRRKIEAAQEAGEPIPEFLPHPDDIVIEPGKHWEVDGPIDAQTLEMMNSARELRDLFLMQHIYEMRRDRPVGTSLNLFVARIIDQKLPKRLQMNDSEIINSPYHWVSSAKLRTLIRKSWRQFGVSIWPGDEVGLPSAPTDLVLAAVGL